MCWTIADSAVYDSDAPEVTLQTTSLVFNDVPEGQTTVRAAVFTLSACQSLTFNISDGPTVLTGAPGVFGTPLGTSVTVFPHDTDTARVWISYWHHRARYRHRHRHRDLRRNRPGFRRPDQRQYDRQTHGGLGARAGPVEQHEFRRGDGRARIDVLKDAAPVFVDLLGDDDAVGVVRFDDDAHPGTPIAVAGPLPFGAGRTAAKAANFEPHTQPGGQYVDR